MELVVDIARHSRFAISRERDCQPSMSVCVSKRKPIIPNRFPTPTTPRAMPFIHVAWLPKACRTPEIRKEVASAIIKAVTAVNGAQITPDKVVVRFSEAVDGFALPPGHTHENVDLPVVKK